MQWRLESSKLTCFARKEFKRLEKLVEERRLNHQKPSLPVRLTDHELVADVKSEATKCENAVVDLLEEVTNSVLTLPKGELEKAVPEKTEAHNLSTKEMGHAGRNFVDAPLQERLPIKQWPKHV
ncbi:unnamed protein product [Protopolystoma xenopodis]|uniref:Uncharacterized protein n=1 Tax=Protopolystoma xenopodis TaxID=117903 RepID=A0A448XCF0_9PLAT|nr:unnamed protein product [Protopolystoma xenopodis]